MRPAVSKRAFQDSSPRMPNCPDALLLLRPRRPPLDPRRADELELEREKPVLPSALTIESACTP